MKKRENILISFFIAWIIVMGVFLIDATIDTIKAGNLFEREVEKYYVGGFDGFPMNLTEEGAKEVNNRLNDWEEVINNYSYEEKIGRVSMEFYNNYLSSPFGRQREIENRTLAKLLILFSSIIILSFVIYFIISIEMKNKKQYIVDNIKLLFSCILLFEINNFLFNLWYNLSLENYSIGDLLVGIVSVLPVAVLIYVVTAVINLIVNLIKNSKKKKLVKEK